jgi:hypothetical protein
MYVPVINLNDGTTKNTPDNLPQESQQLCTKD